MKWTHHTGMARLFGVALGLVAAVLAPRDARAEWRPGANGEAAETLDAEVMLGRPGRTDLTLHDVPLEGKSFESPFHYGLRLTYWFDHAPWGVMLDFTHAKTAASSDDVLETDRTRVGAPASAAEPVGDTFPTLQASHEHNLLTLNGLYSPRSWDWIEPYAGLGLGVAIPQVAVSAGGFQTSEYQVAGPAAQGLAGINFQIYGRFSAFAEYKLSYADIEADLAGGGTLAAEPWTNHFIAGVSFRLF